MTDLVFDRVLSDRLAAYESRLPDAAPPSTDAAIRQGGPRWPLVGIGALAAVAAVLALVVGLGGTRDDVGDASPSPSAAATERPEPSASASAAPASASAAPSVEASEPPPSSPSAGLSWAETASFPIEGGASTVNAVVPHDGGLIAVGAAYDEPLPILGPTPPHEGRVWVSTDGTAWEDVTPTGTFERVALRWLLATSDGALIAHGWQESADGFAIGAPVAFESRDGRTWQAIDQPFGEGSWPNTMAQGGEGAAAVVVDPTVPTLSVWWSGDGRAWERVHELGAELSFALGAGDEGFVVAGTRGSDPNTASPYAIASGDGRAWFEAEAPPGAAAAVAARGGDWVAVSRDLPVVLGQPADAEVWSSANGLSWTPIGGYTLESVERGEGTTCTELPTSLEVAGGWLLSGSMLSFGCSEGGVVTQGGQRISPDGVTWTTLPFGGAATELGLGTRMAGALEVDGRLVLVGERDRVATFWVGEQP